jgi:mRNA interferase HigB
MVLIGRDMLVTFMRRHPDLRGALAAWTEEVERASWRGPKDIKTRYPSASFLAGNLVIFNLKGNQYRLEIQVAYNTGKAIIKRIGTHADYDRWH